MPADLAVSTVLAAAAAIVLAWVTRPADEWMDRFCSSLPTWFALAAIAIACFVSLSNGVRSGIVILCGAALIVRFLHRWMNQRRGGVTLPGFITTALAVEIYGLLILGVLK